MSRNAHLPMAIELCGKVLRHASGISLLCLMSRFPPCISMEGGLSDMRNSQIPYTVVESDP